MSSCSQDGVRIRIWQEDLIENFSAADTVTTVKADKCQWTLVGVGGHQSEELLDGASKNSEVPSTLFIQETAKWSPK